MTESYDPFYEQIFSSTPDSSLENATDYNATQEELPKCYDDVGVLYSVVNGVAYGWNGLPIPSDINDDINAPIAASMILFGIFGLLYNLYCGRVIFKNNSTSRAIKCYLLIDCYCRLNEAWTEFYKAYCVLSWGCVSTDGYPFSGLLVNMIVISFHMGFVYSMQMIGNGLCINRVFAVFFDGLYYSKVEKIALPHALIMCTLPCLVLCYEIGALVNPETGFTCYGCFYFTPLEYSTICQYIKDAVAEFLVYHFDHFMYGVLGVTMVLDVLTLWKVRRLSKLSDFKRRADVRLSIMLVTTHLITICFLLCNYIVNHLLIELYPIGYYLILEVSPFCVHQILGTVVIYFNLPPRSPKPSATTTNSTVISVKQNKEHNESNQKIQTESNNQIDIR